MSLALATKGILGGGIGVSERTVQVGGGDAGLVEMKGKRPTIHVIKLKQRDKFPHLSLVQVRGENGD